MRIVCEEEDSFVGGHPPGEAECEYVGVQGVCGPEGVFHAVSPGQANRHGLGLDPVQKLCGQFLTHSPQFFVRNGIHGLPGCRVCYPLPGRPALSQVAVEKSLDCWRRPGGEVRTIGDVRYGDVVHGTTGKKRFPHFSGDSTVDSAHGVGRPAHADSQGCHPRRLIWVFLPESTEFEQFFVACSQFGRHLGIDLQKLPGRVGFVTRRDGRVCCKNRTAAHPLAGLLKGQPPGGLDARELESCKGRMPLVQMDDGRFDPEGLQCPCAAHPQESILGEPDLVVAFVESCGDKLLPRRVFLQFGIEQKQRDAPHIDAPDVCLDRLAPYGDVDAQRFSLAVRYP